MMGKKKLSNSSQGPTGSQLSPVTEEQMGGRWCARTQEGCYSAAGRGDTHHAATETSLEHHTVSERGETHKVTPG